MTYNQNRAPGQYRGRGGPPQGPRQNRPAFGQLPEGYLANGYFDSAGNLLPQVVIEWPRKIAKELENARMKSTQLRKFFSEVRFIEGQLKAGTDFLAVKTRILKLVPYAEDAIKKGNAPQLFKQFIEQNMKWASQNERAYIQGFVQHFECVVAYFPKNN